MERESNNTTKTSVINYIREHILDLLLGIPSIVTVGGYIKRLYDYITGANVKFTKLELFLGLAILVMSLLWILLLRHRLLIVGNSHHQYKITSLKIRYTLNEDKSFDFLERLKIKAKSNGLIRIIRRFPWLGKLSDEIPTAYSGADKITHEETHGLLPYFAVSLNHSLSIGDDTEFGYKWNHLKDYNNSCSLVNFDTEYHTESIDIEINLGSEYANKEVFIEKFRSFLSDSPLKTTCSSFNEHGIFSWNTKKIRRYRYYRIRWNWINDQNTQS